MVKDAGRYLVRQGILSMPLNADLWTRLVVSISTDRPVV